MRPAAGGRLALPHRPFARLSRGAAALVLALVAAALAWSVWTAAPTARDEARPRAVAAASVAAHRSKPAGEKDAGDMALYARIHARMIAGESYYAAALAEHRASGYPTRPFVAVRLPTLAWLQVAIGAQGVRWLALALTVTAIAALWGHAPILGNLTERLAASLLLALGGGAAFSRVAGFDHDFLAGLLLTLALLAWRERRWWPALAAAAAALAVRELAAPFVLLWLAFALAERRWREAAAVAGVLGLFALGIVLHCLAVDAGRLPGDLVSQGWNARAGLALPLASLGELTGLRLLPPVLAAPLAVLPLVGWAGLGGRSGLFAILWFAGIAAMMALFARPENAYWAELALPAYALGLAFAPRALGELTGRLARQT
jgi:hypothetical protein